MRFSFHATLSDSKYIGIYARLYRYNTITVVTNNKVVNIRARPIFAETVKIFIECRYNYI